MLTISNQANGYKIKISHPGTGTRGFSVFAHGAEEVHHAIDHYLCCVQPSHSMVAREGCPLCRDVEAKRAK